MIFGVAAAYFWLIVLLVCIVAEAITVQLISLWFALGALAAMISAIAGVPVLWQLTIFAVVSLILLLVLYPVVRRHLQTNQAPTNADRIVGETAVVIETIDNRAGTGQIRLLSQTWTARTVCDGIIIPEGSMVSVDSISGVKAMVVQYEAGGSKI